MMDIDSNVPEDASLTSDTADDSCVTQLIEIIPLHISRKDFTLREVKDEFPVDIKEEPEDIGEEYGVDVKQEPEDLHEEYGVSAVNVSSCL